MGVRLIDSAVQTRVLVLSIHNYFAHDNNVDLLASANDIVIDSELALAQLAMCVATILNYFIRHVARLSNR